MQPRLSRSLLSFFGLAYLISWIIWSPLWLPAFGLDHLPVLPYHHALGAYGPLLAAFIMQRIERRRTAGADLLSQMGAVRGRLPYLLIALLGPFFLLLLAAAGVALFSDQSFTIDGMGRSNEFPEMSPVLFLLYNVITFGIGEETGWRGSALPRLQQQCSPLSATLLLTVGWAGWHIPLFFYRPGYVGMDIGGIAGWLLSLVTGAVLLTWLYNSSRQSLAVVALFHATVDVAFTSEMASPMIVQIVGVLITLWGIALLLLLWPRWIGKRVWLPLAGISDQSRE